MRRVEGIVVVQTSSWRVFRLAGSVDAAGEVEGHDRPRVARDATQLTEICFIEAAVRDFFEQIIWPGGERRCRRCADASTHVASRAKMPYRCRDCCGYFLVKTVTVMARLPLRVRT